MLELYNDRLIDLFNPRGKEISSLSFIIVNVDTSLHAALFVFLDCSSTLLSWTLRKTKR